MDWRQKCPISDRIDAKNVQFLIQYEREREHWFWKF